MNLSARAHDRILRVAQTIADLDEAPAVLSKHLAEAVQCRNLESKLLELRASISWAVWCSVVNYRVE